ncbi:ankyrin repeat domain-containing protein [Aquimarina sp. U1-2]|uniref:ankyrin repeat domain-containing protein n=1 Tax=Aquimarina sp. U1-2 TaxID=2823141 RepID=UPI001AED10B1|nr:ankyrin repeat domain-containing protein [Aquimarina sp. U1-2]MBP2832390.1 ankyrin repeat domain-containing protein [Aquimarina sp. U1-2]
MRCLTIISLFVVVLFSTKRVLAQENIFLHREYWKTNPSIAQVKKDVAAGNNPAELNTYAFDAVVYALLEKVDDDVVKYLLSLEGNNINKKTHDSRIYLHWAAYSGQLNIVNYLLKQGSSITELDSHGYTPLTFAANAGQKDSQLYDAFERYGVDLTKEKNENGANVLLLVAHSLSNEQELNYFLDKGLTLNDTDSKGNGIFNYASKKGNIKFLKQLIKKGVDYKTVNKEGGNAFLFAAQGTRGHSNTIEIYEFLKDLGLEPNVVTKKGYTPLHRLAYRNTDPKVFNFFSTAGADVNHKDANGNTPFLNASSRNKLEIVQLLAKNVTNLNLANKKGQTALMLATQNNSPEVVNFLLNKKAAVDHKDEEGNNLAYYLINGYDERNKKAFDAKFKKLKELGLEMDKLQANNHSLWHLAVKKNSLALLQKLADLTIPLNIKNKEGLTPLHLAAMKATNTEILQYLIANGADKTAKTDFDESVYDLASENEILQQRNVSLNFLQ